MKMSLKYMIIISRAKHRTISDDIYTERHHVIPLCCGGEDKEYNIVKLFPQEHYEAHKELALANYNNMLLRFAWFGMCTGNPYQKEIRKIIYTAEDYALAKIACSEMKKGSDGNSEIQKELWKDPEFRKEHQKYIDVLFEEETRKKALENSAKWRKEHAEEISEKASKQMIEQWKDPEFAEKAAAAHRGVPSKRRKRIRYIPTGEEFESIDAASKSGICNKSTIFNHLGEKNKIKERQWEYV